MEEENIIPEEVPATEETQLLINNDMDEPQGYINGSDLLLELGDGCIGHCTSHTISLNSETKERAVKPPKENPISAGLWKGKGVTGLSISINFEGIRFYKETETGLEEIANQWGKGQSINVKSYKRAGDKTPWIEGKFVIDSLEENAPAQDDATYSGSLSNDGEPTTYPGKAAA